MVAEVAPLGDIEGRDEAAARMLDAAHGNSWTARDASDAVLCGAAKRAEGGGAGSAEPVRPRTMEGIVERASGGRWASSREPMETDMLSSPLQRSAFVGVGARGPSPPLPSSGRCFVAAA